MGASGYARAGADPDPAEPSRARRSRWRPRGRTRRPGSTPCTRASPGGSTWPASPSTPTGSPRRATVAFLGLPHTASMAVVPALRERGRPGDRPERRLPPEGRRRSTPTGTATPHTDPDGPAPRPSTACPSSIRDAIPAGRPDRQPRLLHLDEHPGLAPLVAEDLIERTGHHHRRQERRLGGGAVAQADAPTSPSATRASRPTASAGTGTRPRSTRS